MQPLHIQELGDSIVPLSQNRELTKVTILGPQKDAFWATTPTNGSCNSL